MKKAELYYSEDAFDELIEHARQLERELAAVTKDRDNMIQKAEEKHLGGYRELSERLVQALNERDEWKRKAKASFAAMMRSDENARYAKSERDEARNALRRCSLNCEHLSHRKKEQHKYNEPCPVEAMVRKAAGMDER